MMSRLNQRRRGHAVMEFVLLLPFYGTLFFGAMEFGLLFYDRIQLTNACREGLRRAAAGSVLAEIRRGAREAAPRLAIRDDQIAVEYNPKYDGTGGWVTAADRSDGTQNGIPSGLICRVRITGWEHPMMAGSFFSFLPNTRDGRFVMAAGEMMVRQ